MFRQGFFESSEPEEKTQLLNFVHQNFSLVGKNLLFETKNPFAGILEYAEGGSMLQLVDMFRTLNSVKIMQELELCSFGVILDDVMRKLCKIIN